MVRVVPDTKENIALMQKWLTWLSKRRQIELVVKSYDNKTCIANNSYYTVEPDDYLEEVTLSDWIECTLNESENVDVDGCVNLCVVSGNEEIVIYVASEEAMGIPVSILNMIQSGCK